MVAFVAEARTNQDTGLVSWVCCARDLGRFLPHFRAMQAPWKGWCQRRRYREMKVAYPRAATTIQCLWRRVQAQRELAGLKLKWAALQNQKAVALQAILRMRAARERFLFQRTAAVVLQCMYRKYFTARAAWLLAFKHRAVVLTERENAGTTDTPTMVGSVVMRRSQARRYLRCVVGERMGCGCDFYPMFLQPQFTKA